jgi:hypothetical protein
LFDVLACFEVHSTPLGQDNREFFVSFFGDNSYPARFDYAVAPKRIRPFGTWWRFLYQASLIVNLKHIIKADGLSIDDPLVIYVQRGGLLPPCMATCVG